MQEWHSLDVVDDAVVVDVGEDMLRPRINFLLLILFLTVSIDIRAIEAGVFEDFPGLYELQNKCHNDWDILNLSLFRFSCLALTIMDSACRTITPIMDAVAAVRSPSSCMYHGPMSQQARK